MKESILLDIDQEELNILTMALAGGPSPPGPLGDLTQPWRRLQDKVRRHQYQSDLLQRTKEPPVATPTSDEEHEVDYEVTYPLSFVVTAEPDATPERIAEAWSQTAWDWAQEGNEPVAEFLSIRRVDAPDPLTHTYTVTVDGCPKEQADEVMANRISVDEDYGFDYAIDWEPQP